MTSQRTSREQWKEKIAAWDASGLSCCEFARRAGLNASTLSWWRWKLHGGKTRRRRPPRRAPRPAFVEVTKFAKGVEESASPSGDERLELRVGKVTLRLPDCFEEQALVRVLQVLEERT